MATQQIGTAQGTTHLSGDEDWFKVQLTADTLYTFSLPSTRYALVYGSDGRFVERIDGLGFGALAFTPFTSGTYYIGVIGFDAASAYTGTLASVDDDYVSNSRTSGSVAVGGSVNGVINAPGDTDWIRVSLAAHTLYEITLSRQDLSFIVVDGDSLAVDQLGNFGFGEGGSFMPDTAGTYYLSVGTTATTTGSYTVTLRSVADDYRDNVTTSGTLGVGQTLGGRFDARGDHDWLRLNLSANQLYTVTAGGDAQLQFNVFDANGDPVPGNDAAGMMALAFTPATSGVYYLDVADLSRAVGSYTVTLATVADDHPSNPSTGGSVSVGGEISGQFNASGDHDWIRVTLNANTLYSIELEGEMFASVTLMSSNGDPVARPDASSSSGVVGFTPATTGTYYIEVARGAFSFNPDPAYTLKVSTSADDFPSNTSTPGTLAVGGSSSGVINAAAEHDWFKVELTADTLYEFAAVGGAELELYVTDGLLGATEDFQTALSSTGTESKVAYMPATSGTYYLGVSTSDPGVSNYQVALRAVADDYTNNVRTTGVIGSGGSGTSAAPKLAAPLANLAAASGSAFSFSVPAGSFTDADTATLTYSASRADGSALPAWLSFNPATRTFSGNPPAGDASAFVARLTASDGTSSASDTFVISTGNAIGDDWLFLATIGNAWFNQTFGKQTMTILQDGVNEYAQGDPAKYAGLVYQQYFKDEKIADIAAGFANNLGLLSSTAFVSEVTSRLNAVPTAYDRGVALYQITQQYAAGALGDAAMSRSFNLELDYALVFATIAGTVNTPTNADGSPITLPSPSGEQRLTGSSWAGPSLPGASGDPQPGAVVDPDSGFGLRVFQAPWGSGLEVEAPWPVALVGGWQDLAVP